MSDYDWIITSCMAAAVVDEVLDPNRVRPLLANYPEVPSKVIGQVYRRLRQDGTLVEHELVRSNDLKGRNSGKMIFTYKVARPLVRTESVQDFVQPAHVESLPAPVKYQKMTLLGPCAACGGLHERYGPGGSTHCEWCTP